MTIAVVDVTTPDTSSSVPATLTYNTATVGNLLLAVASGKPTSRTATTPTPFAGTGGTGIGGTGTNGSDTGPTRLYLWWRTADGTEPASEPITWSTVPSPYIGAMFECSKSNVGAWDVAYAFGSDSTQSTGTDAIDATATTDPGFTTGDMVVVAMSFPTDLGTFTNPRIVIPGCTVGTVATELAYPSTSGNDGGMRVWSAQVTAGTSTSAPQFLCDVDDLNASAGPAGFARVREPAGSTPLGTATEADAAMPLTGTKAGTLGVAAETSTGEALAGAKTGSLGPAGETDTAQPLTGEKSATLAPALETDQAIALESTTGQTLAVAVETDAAVSLVGEKSSALGTAAETSAAVGLTGAKSGDLGVAVETDTAMALTSGDERDITITGRVLPSRWSARVLPSRWKAEVLP